MVDDDPTILELSAIFLERAGDIQVDGTESAADALKRLEGDGGPYHVIISDYAMPDMDGIAFLKAVRSRKLEIPFILFTGKSREEVVIEALNSGADYYLQKDGRPTVLFVELSHQIRQAAERYRSRREDLVKRDLALQLSGATSLSAALQRCVEAAIAVSETDCGTMYLLDRASGCFVLRHSEGLSPEYVAAISKRRRNPSTSLIARAEGPIYINYQEKDLPLQEAREREGLRAMAAVPIHHEGEVIGYLASGPHRRRDPLCGSERPGDDRRLTGNAIDRLRAQEELRRSEEQLRASSRQQSLLLITDDPTQIPPSLSSAPGLR
jgi:DNA-binding response OmpR family regulator